MYGWRGRIGHVYPAVVAETYMTDFFRVVPEGITLAMTNLSIQAIRDEDLKRSEAQLDQAIGFLAKRKVDCIIVGGGPIFSPKRHRLRARFRQTRDRFDRDSTHHQSTGHCRRGASFGVKSFGDRHALSGRPKSENRAVLARVGI